MTKKHFLIAIVLLVIADIALFWKFYFEGLIPFPGNLLVSFYFPWNSGGFSGFDPWTTRKDVIAMDVIRQMYPWKTLAADLIKSGQWPVWNPFNFSGTPLLANVQSSIFFPGTVLFLVLPYLSAWLVHVILLPLLFSLFIYIYLRSLKLSNWAAIFGAIVASNISYITVWAEQLIIIQSVLFLPLVLWIIEKFSQTRKKIYVWLLPVFLALSIFGGHPQTIVYVFLITLGYMFYRRIPVVTMVLVILLLLGLAAIQLLPSLELYWYSAREVTGSQVLFFASSLPWQNLATMLIPDIFGNPATNNYIGRDYGNFQAYFGVAALLLALIAVIKLFKNRPVRFFVVLAFFGLIFSLPPFAFIFSYLKIPILSSGYPSRMIFLFQFGAAILSAFGFDYLLNAKNSLNKKTWIAIAIPTLIAFGLIVLIVFQKINLPATRNYLLLISLVWVGTALAIKFARLRLLLLAIAIFEYAYFFNKYQPFAPAKFVFPPHPVFNFLQEHGAQDRFFGFDRAYVDSNFATYFRVYSAEGYDPLYVKRYGELLTGSVTGQLDKQLPRSDAWISIKNVAYRDRIMDLLGVRYIIDKTDDPKTEWEPNLYLFLPDKYDMVWRVNKWKIFSRKSVLPRAFLADKYLVETNDGKIVSAIYDKDFDYRQTLILEKDPKLTNLDPATGSAQISEYSPNKVKIQTQADGPKLLFLSDGFYPGWQVTIDGQPGKILRADYAFRAVVLPPGQHEVVFAYNPVIFKLGAIVSFLSLLTLGACLKKFYHI